MISLYTAATPNGWKASVTLEELDLPYTVNPVDLSSGAQKEPAFLQINPNGRIPAIVDHDNDDFTIMESGAIMIYLAEKAGKLMPTDTKGRSEVIQWLMFQMAGIGPMQGQAFTFMNFFPEHLPTVIERYKTETARLYGVLNSQLKHNEFLAGEFSIADIANWCWVRGHDKVEIAIDEFPDLQRWITQIDTRPASAKGIAVPDLPPK